MKTNARAADLFISFICLATFSMGGLAPARADDRPRLVVVVSIDQWAYRYFDRFRDGLGQDGIVRRCQTRGAWFANCHHFHAFTYTGPGHAVQLTGAYPAGNGIIANDWYDRGLGKIVYCVEDPACRLIGATAEDKPVSPRTLYVDTLGDQLKLASAGKSKVYGVAFKDRAAILMTGMSADAAFWLSSDGKWVTSDYYRDSLPGYLRELNEQGAIKRFAQRTWELLQESNRYHHGPSEDSFGERPKYDISQDFPHHVAAADHKDFVNQVACSPFGNELTLEAALQILHHEQLGLDDDPDLLAINLSSNDYVGHLFGPQSLEVEDMTYRTDLQMAQLADEVSRQLGDRPWTLVVTADHGIAPIPEVAARLKLPGKRDPFGEADKDTGNLESLRKPLDDLLRAEFGVPAEAPDLVEIVLVNQVYLKAGHKWLGRGRSTLAQKLVRDRLLQHESIAVALTREQLLAGAVHGRIEEAIRRSFHPKRSGDVVFVLAPYQIDGSTATTHGSPWGYDTHVPLLLLHHGSGPWAKSVRGRFQRRVSVAAIAPTLAVLLGVEAPSGCVEQPLREILPD